MEAGVYSQQTRNRRQKGFHAQEPHGVPLGFRVTLFTPAMQILPTLAIKTQAAKDPPHSLPGGKRVCGRPDLRPIRQQSLTAPTSQKKSKPS